MAHRQRWYLTGTMVEVTIRTLGGKFWLRPDAACKAIIEGVFGKAMKLYPGIQLHGYDAQSNHLHYLLSAADPEQVRGAGCSRSDRRMALARLSGPRCRWRAVRYERVGQEHAMLECYAEPVGVPFLLQFFVEAEAGVRQPLRVFEVRRQAKRVDEDRERVVAVADQGRLDLADEALIVPLQIVHGNALAVSRFVATADDLRGGGQVEERACVRDRQALAVTGIGEHGPFFGSGDELVAAYPDEVVLARGAPCRAVSAGAQTLRVPDACRSGPRTAWLEVVRVELLVLAHQVEHELPTGGAAVGVHWRTFTVVPLGPSITSIFAKPTMDPSLFRNAAW